MTDIDVSNSGDQASQSSQPVMTGGKGLEFQAVESSSHKIHHALVLHSTEVELLFQETRTNSYIIVLYICLSCLE